MATISALLKNASNIRDRLRAQEDAFKAYDYSLSAKTYNDFLDYQSYLNNRMATTNDPSAKLGYVKDIQSARKAFTSNELQRSSIDIIEGRGTLNDKYEKMVGLFYQAIDYGDYDNAQTIHLQLDNLSVQIQNEQEKAGRAAATLAKSGSKNIGQLINKIKKGNELVELSDGRVVKPIPMLVEEMKTSGDTSKGFFDELRNTVEGLQNYVIDTYESATTQEAVDAIEEKYGDLITGDYKFSIGGQSLTAEDIIVAAKSNAANNPIFDVQAHFNEASGMQEFKLVKNKIDNFVWIRNDDGTYSAIQERTKVASANQKLDTKLTDDGYVIGKDGKIGTGATLDKYKVDKSQSIGQRLAAMGITAAQNDDGTLDITLADGMIVTGTIEADGTIHYAGAPGKYSGPGAGMYEINVLNGQTREVAPDEISDFGTISQFGGMLSQSSEAGKGYIDSFLGKKTSKYTPVDLSHAIIDTALDFSGKATPLKGVNFQGTDALLQGAGDTRNKLAAQQASRDAALRSAAELAQRATNFNLNQTPVRQIASNGAPVRQLTVTRAVAPRISAVTVATPQKIAPVRTTTSGLGVSNVSGSYLQGGNSIRL